MVTEVLAEAWWQQGELAKAVNVLERASQKWSAVLGGLAPELTGPQWLRLQAQLAQLYREMGRDADALRIENELRKLLAYADADHPILRQLDRTEDLALLQPTNN